MNKIDVFLNRTLKLTNVLCNELIIKDDTKLELIVEKMDSYIKSKGAIPIGPLIQKNNFTIDENEKVETTITLMRQSNNYIHNVETPYKIESLVRVRDCIYARFTGPQNKLGLTYDKINVTAFEENIELSDENYTILVDQQDDYIIADVFVEKKTNK